MINTSIPTNLSRGQAPSLCTEHGLQATTGADQWTIGLACGCTMANTAWAFIDDNGSTLSEADLWSIFVRMDDLVTADQGRYLDFLSWIASEMRDGYLTMINTTTTKIGN